MGSGEDMILADIVPLIFVGSIFFVLTAYLGVEYVRAKLSWDYAVV